MNPLVPVSSPALPMLVTTAGERATMRFLEFFAANIRNPHTRHVSLTTGDSDTGRRRSRCTDRVRCRRRDIQGDARA